MPGVRGYSRIEIDEHVKAAAERRAEKRLAAVTDWTDCQGCGRSASARTLEHGRCLDCVQFGVPKGRN